MSNIMNDYAVVSKISVSDINTSVKWYSEKLGCEVNKKVTQDPAWRQLILPNISTVIQIGLYQSQKVGTGSGVLTLVVKDIESARNDLIAKGVTVSPISDVGQGVSLAFFNDLDGNQLGLRQNTNGELFC